MDGSRFGNLPRFVQEARTRRAALRAALGGAVASGVAAASMAARGGEAEAKRKKKKCKKKTCPACEALFLGSPCTTNLQCCTNETNMLCALASNATTNATTCCGGVGAPCATTNDCCGDFTCDGGRCDS